MPKMQITCHEKWVGIHTVTDVNDVSNVMNDLLTEKGQQRSRVIR